MPPSSADSGDIEWNMMMQRRRNSGIRVSISSSEKSGLSLPREVDGITNPNYLGYKNLNCRFADPPISRDNPNSPKSSTTLLGGSRRSMTAVGRTQLDTVDSDVEENEDLDPFSYVVASDVPLKRTHRVRGFWK